MKVPTGGDVPAPKDVSLPLLKTKWSPNHSSRNGQKVHLVVLHDTEGGYEGSVSWLCNPKAQASAHVVVREDGCEATQLVKWDEKAWACMAFNSVSDNIELAGFHDKLGVKELRVAARIVAFRLKERGLPPKWSRTGKEPGFCRHYDLGLAGGGHSDPSKSLPYWLKFVVLVKYEAARGKFRANWGQD